jgi:hypothetical protein
MSALDDFLILVDEIDSVRQRADEVTKSLEQEQCAAEQLATEAGEEDLRSNSAPTTEIAAAEDGLRVAEGMLVYAEVSGRYGGERPSGDP